MTARKRRRPPGASGGRRNHLHAVGAQAHHSGWGHDDHNRCLPLDEATVERGLLRLDAIAGRLERGGCSGPAADVRALIGTMSDGYAKGVDAACLVATGIDMDTGATVVDLWRCGYDAVSLVAPARTVNR